MNTITRDEHWMSLAIQEAEKALADGEIPVGAVMVHQGRLLCSASNRRERDQNPAAHAEMLCIQKAAAILGRWRLHECTLYVTLEPCPMCAGAALMSRLSRCVWGAADARQGCCGSVYDLLADPALGGQTNWTGGVLAQPCAELLSGFFRQRRQDGSQHAG